MTIHIEALTFECIIGILDFERLAPQKVIIDAQINYDYTEGEFINYVEIIELLQNNMINNKYQLLETALNELEMQLLVNYSTIDNFMLKISKPNIIDNAKVSLSTQFSKT